MNQSAALIAPFWRRFELSYRFCLFFSACFELFSDFNPRQHLPPRPLWCLGWSGNPHGEVECGWVFRCVAGAIHIGPWFTTTHNEPRVLAQWFDHSLALSLSLFKDGDVAIPRETFCLSAINALLHRRSANIAI